MGESKVAKEVAEEEFNRFAEAWDLDSDVSTMEEEDRQSFEVVKRRVVRKIESGHLTVDEAGTPTYRPMAPTLDSAAEIVFTLPTGQALIQWDKFKDRQQIHKLNAFMGSMTGQPPVLFAKMDGRDLKVCQSIAQLFLGS
jgi:hypothetical protein